MTAQVAIETPEGVRFALRLAGPIARFLAWVIDVLAIGAATSAAAQLFQFVGALNRDWMIALITLSYFAISIGYGMAFEWFWRGQTPGKRVLRLRLIDAQGLKLHFSQVAIRNLLRFLDALPVFYLVGGAAMILTRDAQRLGDLAANTIVIRERRVAPLDTAPLLAGKFNSLLEYPHLASRLRQRTPPALVQAALQGLMRRDELEPAARIEVFRGLREMFAKLVQFPEDATAALTDEQYVRAAVHAAMTR